MKTVIAYKDQNLTDIAIQHYGSVEGIVELLRDNGFDLTKTFTANESIIVNDQLVFKREVVEHFKKTGEKIVTGRPLATPIVEAGIFDNTFDETFE